MQAKIKKVRQSINKAWLKVKPNRSEIDLFKKNLTELLVDRINENESEEHHKKFVSAFLENTYYSPNHYINTKGRSDQVIHNGKEPRSTVGVIIEAKKPTNKADMLSRENINTKALQELVLYYLRERINLKNLEIKHLIATNMYEWFVFDAAVFEKTFAQSKSFVKQFTDFEAGRLSGTNTDFFYSDIAAPFIEEHKTALEFTWFDLREYEKPLRNNDKKDDAKLIALYKLFSPEHLLKLPFANDSNSLDRKFYTELLHIIGLEETKVKGKKLIGRKEKERISSGSILENAITQIDSHDKLSRLSNLSTFGETREERLFNVGLELCITWVNRILFLKLLEAQLIAYHKGDEAYSFLNLKRIKDYDVLDTLFFQVLARKHELRSEEIQAEFGNIPYLNSSLFDPTDLEHDTLMISNLRDDMTIPVISGTVLKDNTGKKITGTLSTLEYLFRFLDAYDFSSEGSEAIQEDNKTLINASVLGLIFEKINGYKDGSFFTPGFITMYMCRETIRRAVVQKFNEAKGWTCETLDDLYEEIEDRGEANDIINSLKICDPAVGSGHFLVSALNEILAIKNDLNLLQDRNGRRLKEYELEVVNDELIITDENGELFEYHYASKESQRVQEALFHEKQTIIENCLFGVDINPNSVKICRLRLWIELLKHAYYKSDSELETLPNIDINIKVGNSLISRFALDANLKEALKKSKWSIDSYRAAVATYRDAQSKEQKREMERLIEDIKSDFRTEIASNDPKVVRLKKLSDELVKRTTQTSMFEQTAKEKKEWKKKTEKLTQQIQKLETEIEEIKSNKIYENAFEWRFEFPEVLNEQGDFVGFDVVIGNPPYGRYQVFSKNEKKYLKNSRLYGSTGDIAEFFINLVLNGIIKKGGEFSFIVPKGLSYVKSWNGIRERFLNETTINSIVDTSKSFQEALYEMLIFHVKVVSNTNEIVKTGYLSEDHSEMFHIPMENYSNKIFYLGFPQEYFPILNKLNNNSEPVSKYYDYWYGKGGMTPKVNKSGTGIKVLTGKEIQRYFFKNIDPEWFLSDTLIEEEDIKLAEKRKVVVQDIVAHIKNPVPHIKLTATIDESGQFCLNTVMCFSEKKETRLTNEFLVALINSKLISFYYYYFVFNQAIRTMHFMPGYSDRLPIHKDAELYHQNIEKHSSKILALKKENPQADTSVMEVEIDQMVYELYGLTDEEIAIVEESIG